MAKSAPESDSTGVAATLPGSHRWGRGAIAGAGAGALALAAVAGVAFWPTEEPAVSPSPSGNSDPSPSVTSAAPPELPWGEPIPWDEVGPGWTLLAYDAVPDETEWGEEWNFAGDELRLLAPDGTLFFGADISGLGAMYIDAWTGQEVWLYAPTEYQGEFSTGTLWNVDLTNGTITLVAEDSPSRGSREPTAVEGISLSRGGCCGCTETVALYADGSTRLLGEGCGESSLSPDGLTLAYVTESEINGEYHTSFRVTDLDGNSTPVADSPFTNWMHDLMWLNDRTLLVFPGGDADNPVLTEIDVASGASSPWSGDQPEGFYLLFWAGYPGSWLIWEAYEPERITRITDRAGGVRLDLACAYPSCTPHASGGLIIWEESDVEYVDGVQVGEDLQRLTLIDPASGERTLVLEYVHADGHITSILPYPRVYG